MQRKLELQQFIALFFVICPLSPSQEPIYFPLPLNLELVQIFDAYFANLTFSDKVTPITWLPHSCFNGFICPYQVI